MKPSFIIIIIIIVGIIIIIATKSQQCAGWSDWWLWMSDDMFGLWNDGQCKFKNSLSMARDCFGRDHTAYSSEVFFNSSN